MQVIMHTIDSNCIDFIELNKERQQNHNLHLRHHMNTTI